MDKLSTVLKGLVAQDVLGEAIRLALSIQNLDTDHQNALIILSAKHREHVKRKLKGLDVSEKEVNKIRSTLLDQECKTEGR